MTQTPLQQAIEYWTARREEAPTIQMEQAADLFLQYLNASLPSEKEFVGNIYPKGYSDRGAYKQQFINQLYPEK